MDKMVKAYEAIYSGKAIKLPNFHFTVEEESVKGQIMYVGYCLDFSISESTTEKDFNKAVKKLFNRLCKSVTNYIEYFIINNKIDDLYNSMERIPNNNIWGAYQEASIKNKIEILKESIDNIEYDIVFDDNEIDIKDIIIEQLKNENSMLKKQLDKLLEHPDYFLKCA